MLNPLPLLPNSEKFAIFVVSNYKQIILKMTDKINKNSADLQGEVWKSVVGYEGIYEVSNMGRVKSIARICAHKHGQCRRKETLMKLTPCGKGVLRHSNKYRQVRLTKNGVSKLIPVHRLVAMAFLPNPHNLPQVNHKDENPSNNNVENLEWCDAKYNCNYGTLPSYRSDFSSRAVMQFSLDGVFIAEYSSITKASKTLGLRGSIISEVCKGVKGSSGGFLWRYSNPTTEEVQSVETLIERKDKHKIVQLTLDGNFVALYDSVKSAALAMGCSLTCISYCVVGKTHTSRGFRWVRYSEYKKAI